MKKRIILFMLILSMLVNILPFITVSAAENGIYSVDGLHLRSGQKGVAKQTQTEYTLTGAVIGSFIEGTVDAEKAGVYHFFADIMSGYDLQFAVNNKNVGEKFNVGNAYKSVDLGSVEVEKAGKITFRFTVKSDTGNYVVKLRSFTCVKEAVKISAETQKLGNIFVEGEPVEFVIKLDNILSHDVEGILKIEAVSCQDEHISIESVPVAVKTQYSKSVTLPITQKGTYELVLTLELPQEDEAITVSIPFSYIIKMTNFQKDSIIGTCLHIQGTEKNSDKMQNHLSLLKKVGIQDIRDDHYWNKCEKEKGVYTFYNDDLIETMVENDIEPFMILNGGNSVQGGIPHTEAGYKAFAEYAYAVAERYKGKVKRYEILNEWNGGNFNDGYGVEHYIEIVKAVYPAIKKADPDAKVVIGASITAAHKWFETLFQNGCLDYCDGISYHPYSPPDSVDMKNYRGNNEDNAEIFYNLMKKYGEPKTQYLTEIGWFNGTYVGSGGRFVDEETQAKYTVRTYISGMAYNLEKIYIYNLVDKGTNLADKEHNWGMVQSASEDELVPYAAKQVYVATAAVNQFLKKAVFKAEYRPYTDVRIYKFHREDIDKDVVALYYIAKQGYNNAEAMDIEIGGKTASMQAYDLYGNPCEITQISTKPVYLMGERGSFDIHDIRVKKKESVFSVFGNYKNSDGIYTNHITGDIQQKMSCFTLGEKEKEIICNVDDSYIYGGVNPIYVEISYLDSGKNAFYMEYDAGSGTKQTQPVQLKNTQKWLTAKFPIEDAHFKNSLDGNDFIIKMSKDNSNISFGGVRIYKMKDEKKRLLSMDFSAPGIFPDPHTNNRAVNEDMRVQLFNNAFVGFERIEKDGRIAIFASGDGDARYLAVDADDTRIAGSFQPVKVYVDYYDEGKGCFSIGYDSGSWNGFSDAEIVTLQDTKQWKTAEFILDKCWWQNECNHVSDFRVALWTPTMGKSPEGVYFGGIRLEVMDGVEDILPKKVSFSDSKGHWAEKTLIELAEKNSLNGYDDGTCRPEEKITRSEFLVLLLRALKLPVIPDQTDWSRPYIEKSVELGLVFEHQFDPYDQEITRYEMAQVIAKILGASDNSLYYADQLCDRKQIPEKLLPDVCRCYQAGIMRGDDDGCFSGDRSATRAEASMIIYNLLNR